MVRKPKFTPHLGTKRLKILFWDLTWALRLYLRLVLLAVERFLGVSPLFV